MADLAPWPDPHLVLVNLLDDLIVSDIVGSQLQPDFQQDMPVIRVRKVGGTDDKLTDFVRMVVDVYAADYETSRDLSEAVRQRLLSYPHITTAGRLDRCETEASPFELPWPDPSTRYHTATYRLSFRR